jgi:flagellar hook-associated protein 2
VTFDLLSPTATGQTVNLGVSLDSSALSAKVGNLITGLNKIVLALKKQLDYTGTKPPSSQLFGDSTLERLQTEIAGVIGGAYGKNADSTADIGINLARDGTISFDSAKFQAAVASDSTIASKVLLGTSNNGLSKALSDIVNTYGSPFSGLLASESKQFTDDSASYDKLITNVNAVAAGVQARLQKQFADMESVLSKLQTESSYLTALSNLQATTSNYSSSSASISKASTGA